MYDGEGRRIQVTENGTTTTYIYSGLNVLYEENSTGTATYIYGPRGRLAKRTTINQESNTFYYHSDHLGSTRLVTDDSGNIVSAVTYRPFGEVYSEEGSEDYLFNGKERDATGLYYYGARYYDPEIGRFITRDPLGGVTLKPQSLNRYTYCVNNPLKYVDPTGLSPGISGDEARADWRDERAKKDEEESLPGGLKVKYDEDLYRYPHLAGFLFFVTPVYRVGNVGVAIGWYGTANTSHYTPMYFNHGYGLVIFIFDENDNIIDVIFIPLRDLGNENKMRKWYITIKDSLDKYKIDLIDLYDALELLKLYCDYMSDLHAGFAGLGGAVWGTTAAILVATWETGVPIFIAASLAVEAWKWDRWEDIIGKLQFLVSRDMKPRGGGGGF